MAEDNPFVRGNEVAAVFEALGRRRARVVQFQDAISKKTAIEPITDRINAGGSHYQPHSIDRFALGCGDNAKGNRAEAGDPEPEEFLDCTHLNMA